MLHVERRDGPVMVSLRCDDCGALGPKVVAGAAEVEWDGAAARAAFPLGWTERRRGRHVAALCPKCAGAKRPDAQMAFAIARER